MQTTIRQMTVAIAALAQLATWTGFGEDTFAPCWRGRETSTYQNWEFGTGDNPAAPTAANNPYGNPQATITSADGWYDELYFYGNRRGAWGLNPPLFGRGKISLSIPNMTGCQQDCVQYVKVQVTFYRDGLFYTNAEPTVSITGATKLRSTTQIIDTNPESNDEQWLVQQTTWKVVNYGTSTTVDVNSGNGANDGGSIIDQVIVDTYFPTRDNGDLYVPCWRGQPETTYQSWSFHVDGNPATPEIKNNQGSPQATISTVTGVGWIEFTADWFIAGCRQGVWDLGAYGSVNLTIPSQQGSGSSFKYIQVQVLQLIQTGLGYNTATITISGAEELSESEQVVESASNTFGTFTWKVKKVTFRVSPAAATDTIQISSTGDYGLMIDQIVVDTLTMEIPWPDNITASADPGACSKADVTWQLPDVDDCKIKATNSSPASGSTFNVGQTTVTLSVTTAEKVETHQITVTISDNEPPAAKCKDITLFLSGSGTATIGAGDVDNNSTDNCGIQAMVVAPSSFSCENVGANTVTLTVTDVNGNTAACTATVTVYDNQAPTITAPADVTANADSGKCYATGVELGTAATGDNCSVASVDNDAPGQFPVGTTTVTWTVRDVNGNTAQATQTVTVYDNQAPTITAPADVTANADSGKCYATGVELGTAATGDNCSVASVDNDAPGQFPVGTTTVTWTVRDVNGNTAQATQTVTVYDNQAPVISGCPGNMVVNVEPGTCQATVSWEAPTATDNCTVASLTPTHAPGSVFNEGSTVVTYTAIDASGNMSKCSFIVTVTDNTPPAVTKGSIASCYQNVMDAEVAAIAATEAVDACGTPILTAETVGTCSAIIMVTARDGAGNSASVSYETRIDNEAPVIGDITAVEGTVNVKNGAATVVQGTVTIKVTATDNCGLINARPSVSLKNGANVEEATFVEENPSGTFTYTWNVNATTANGTWTVIVNAADGCQTSQEQFTLNVNKAQITGEVQLQGVTVASLNRSVVFKATDSNGTVIKTWNVAMNFTSGHGTFTLTDVPENTVRLSAKTDWTLRRRLGVSFDGNMQANVNFTGDSGMLLGGDAAGTALTEDGLDVVNLADYGVLASKWLTNDPRADFDGNGTVFTGDYNLVKMNMNKVGDPE